jgi:hypothetical protein
MMPVYKYASSHSYGIAMPIAMPDAVLLPFNAVAIVWTSRYNETPGVLLCCTADG